MPELFPSVLSQVADYFKVLSEVSRLQILCCLKTGAKNVTEIITETGLGQANVSKHLKVLAQAGIVKRTPEGVSVIYEIADPILFQLCDLVCDALGERSYRLAVRLQEQTQQLSQLGSNPWGTKG
ncbi:MAG: metalloregulator ArsR/SmtB family transcription factor [Nodularia sp. (in: cyanobacteria)]|nr:metalloregulator ArsR/SmtB family transcription factor [Nodularia sp. (in: cyanobacteria)]